MPSVRSLRFCPDPPRDVTAHPRRGRQDELTSTGRFLSANSVSKFLVPACCSGDLELTFDAGASCSPIRARGLRVVGERGESVGERGGVADRNQVAVLTVGDQVA